MADNVALPAVTGSVESRDIGSGVERQIVAEALVTASTDITRPADTAAYAAGDALANSTSGPTASGFTLTGVGIVSGGAGVITDMIITSSNPAGGLQGEIWIFDSAVTAVNDNAAFAISDAEVKTLVAVVPFTLVAGTNNAQAAVDVWKGYTCSGSANLRYLVRVAVAYTPTSSEVITVRAKAIQFK